MSELVVMPKTDWQDILDSTRAKAGTTELIKSGDLATIIDNLAIGSNLSCISKIACGTIIPATDITSDYTVEHGLGVTPSFCLLVVKERYDVAQYALLSSLSILKIGRETGSGTEKYGWRFYSKASKVVNTSLDYVGNFWVDDGLYVSETGSSGAILMAEGNLTIKTSSICKLVAGHTYYWIAGTFISELV